MIRPNDNGAWFSISPDESLMAFLENDSTQPDSPIAFCLVTMDLASGAKTRHSLNELPAGTISITSLTPWQAIEGSMAAAGWDDGTFSVYCWQCHGSWSLWIGFTHGAVDAFVVKPDARALGCSDCPPPGAIETVTKARGIQTNGREEWFSVAYRDGHVSDNLYLSNRKGSGEQLVRIDGTGARKIVHEQKRAFREFALVALRVSPDERYLAYAVAERIRSPFPTPGVCKILVLDMKKRTTLRVQGSFNSVGSLAWSADSRRLYFGAFGNHSRGVYRLIVVSSTK